MPVPGKADGHRPLCGFWSEPVGDNKPGPQADLRVDDSALRQCHCRGHPVQGILWKAC